MYAKEGGTIPVMHQLGVAVKNIVLPKQARRCSAGMQGRDSVHHIKSIIIVLPKAIIVYMKVTLPKIPASCGHNPIKNLMGRTRLMLISSSVQLT